MTQVEVPKRQKWLDVYDAATGTYLPQLIEDEKPPVVKSPDDDSDKPIIEDAVEAQTDAQGSSLASGPTGDNEDSKVASVEKLDEDSACLQEENGSSRMTDVSEVKSGDKKSNASEKNSDDEKSDASEEDSGDEKIDASEKDSGDKSDASEENLGDKESDASEKNFDDNKSHVSEENADDKSNVSEENANDKNSVSEENANDKNSVFEENANDKNSVFEENSNDKSNVSEENADDKSDTSEENAADKSNQRDLQSPVASAIQEKDATVQEKDEPCAQDLAEDQSPQTSMPGTLVGAGGAMEGTALNHANENPVSPSPLDMQEKVVDDDFRWSDPEALKNEDWNATWLDRDAAYERYQCENPDNGSYASSEARPKMSEKLAGYVKNWVQKTADLHSPGNKEPVEHPVELGDNIDRANREAEKTVQQKAAKATLEPEIANDESRAKGLEQTIGSFVVAIKGWWDIKKGNGEVVGFALMDVAIKGIAGSRETNAEGAGKLTVVVHQDYRRLNICSAMIDVVLFCCSHRYAVRLGYQIVNPENDHSMMKPEYNPRQWKTVDIEVVVWSHVDEQRAMADPRYKWISEYLDTYFQMKPVSRDVALYNVDGARYDRVTFRHHCHPAKAPSVSDS